ncbi:radical SAM family heme chaperone HemW [soil metagenome]
MIRHLYIHIPFCHRICPYCSFYKHRPGKTSAADLVASILAELRQRQDGLGVPVRPRTIYLGGGTPSLLAPTHLSTLLGGLRSRLDLADLTEWTLEANPATFDAAKAQLMADEGITRVSLGVQSFDPAVLATLGRDHSPAAAARSFGLLREAGIPSVNVDLMFSIPGQSLECWERSLDAAIALSPDHLSAYNLTYEQDTPFFERFEAGTYRDDPDQNAAFFSTAIDRLAAAGFEHYETSNYAQPGHRSAHNQAYWCGQDYLGLGPGAVSTVAGNRWTNVKDTARYASGDFAPREREAISPEAFALERLALQLRTAEGLPAAFLTPDQHRKLDDLAAGSLATFDGQYLTLTRQGHFLVDSIAAYLVS